MDPMHKGVIVMDDDMECTECGKVIHGGDHITEIVIGTLNKSEQTVDFDEVLQLCFVCWNKFIRNPDET